ncbi:MAG: hypothetical protein JWL70_2235 [Acidimicrobiia bacterium]|nr:hypothetical protein [Acidimicrobiia bacterium]
MNAIIIYESLTGNTRKTAARVGSELVGGGVHVTSICPIIEVDLPALALADVVILGGWVDGLLIVGQKPGRLGRLHRLPAIGGKKAVSFCTYAINPGRTLDTMDRLLESRGGESIGGLAINRRKVEAGAEDLASRVISAMQAQR